MFQLLVAGIIACAPGKSTGGATGADWIAPDNRWFSRAPPDDLIAEGYEEGDTPPDVRLPDQYGDEVSLWQFYGQLVLIDISPMWCAPCQDLARGVEQLVLDYEGEPLVYINLVAETVEGDTPGPEHAEEWATSFGIASTPVLADLEGFYVNFTQSGSYPIVVGISPEMRIFEGGFVAVNGEPDIRSFIDQNL